MQFNGKSPFSGLFNQNSDFLTPVYFSIEALEKYYDDPKYLVFFTDYRGTICLDDKYVSSSGDNFENIKNFGLAYQKNDRYQRAIVLFATDLFEMPLKQQCYWYSFLLDHQENYYPNSGFVQNLILGEWVEEISIFQALTMELHYINLMCDAMGIPHMFKKEFPSDGRLQNERPNNYHTILLPTAERYYNFVSTLEKMLTGNLDIKCFQKETPTTLAVNRKDERGNNKGSVTMLCDWFSINISHVDIESLLRTPLRNLVKIRQTPAHEIYDNKYDPSFWKRQDDLMQEVYIAIRNIRLLLANHPQACTVTIPDVLFDGEHIAIY